MRRPASSASSTSSTACPRRSTTRPRRPTVDYDPDARCGPTTCSAPSRPPAIRPRCRRRARARRRGHEHHDLSEDETAALRRRLIISAVLSLPVLLMAMIPGAAVRQLAVARACTLATPVVVWGAWPFHKAAWANAKHGTATMDTLISVGVLAAWLWSLYALFLGGAGMTGMRMPFELIPKRGAGADHIYLEVAAAVTTLILLGRYFEARAKRRAGAALKALLELGAKDVAVLDDDGRETRIPVEQLSVGQRFVVRPGEKVATDGVVEEGSSAVDMSMLTGESVPGRGPARAPRSRARPSTPAGASSSAPPRSAPTPRSPRSRGSSRTPRPARRPYSGSPTASRRLRARRHRPRRSPTLVAGCSPGESRELRVHGRGRRAHHRLPVRARPGHPDGADGRHRPRRATRAAHQGTGGARVHPPGRHRSCSTRPAPSPPAR